ncbi:hypothetical protein [Gordonia sp. NPDC058843]|uniref:hypothetical protein n=1 Tax=Gordonia sp. NPDC058843 TaxID=3346648 RepID=UPI003691BF1A
MSTVDDLVISAPAADGVSTVRLDIAVRRAPRFVRSDVKTKDLVRALVRADLAAERASDPLVERRLAVVVSGHSNHVQEVTQLSVLARGQSNANEFFELVTTPGKFASRPRLIHLRDMVAAALTMVNEGDAGSAEHRCWSLLTRLWMMQLDLEPGEESDWSSLIDDLTPVAIGGSHQAAVALRERMEQLSGELASVSGAVDAVALRRRLHGEINPDAHAPPVGWNRLLRLDKEARSAVGRALGDAESGSLLTLPRQDVRNELRNAIASPGDLLVRGDSGVGKSALVMDAIESTELGSSRQAVAVNLRHLPSGHLDLLTALVSPLDDLFSELTAPDRILVIDGAEAASEQHGQVFSELLRSAHAEGLKVVAVAATEGAGAATELMKSAVGIPREYVVPSLNDQDIAAAAAHFTQLQRLIDEPRARELLRRPIVIDLLSRASDPGVPLSESEALDHIWQDLVRNGGRTDAGAPDARERVMLRLARHAVTGGDIDDLLDHIDDAAVAGLRQSGVLLPASSLPWERLPQFKHDLIRVYSVARYFLRERDPVKALKEVGAPRWALPSARLACEMLLSAPDTPTYPLQGRFAQLQAGFDSITVAGGGERWRDVPTEALLVVRSVTTLLSEAWPTFLSNDAHRLAGLLRVLDVRHKNGITLDTIVAEPVVARLIDEEVPRGLSDAVARLMRDWLQTHVIRDTPQGHPTRVALRESILRQCAAEERNEDKKAADRKAELAARSPEKIAEDEERQKRYAAISSYSSGLGRRRRRSSTRHLPYLWISDTQIEHLALLGPDLGKGGEAVLRRIAEDAPHSLDHAVEPYFAGNSLAAYDPRLLIDLAGAYYIEEEEDDDYGFGSSGGLLDDGIRGHRFGGLGDPLSSFTYGPFIALLRSDFRGGVALLNRMLNHAARCRVRTLSDRRYEPLSETGSDQYRHSLSITGRQIDYIGDGQVWLWYRGTGVGPYPCISALQALEFVTEEFIRLAEVPPESLTAILMDGAESLAMPALVLGILVRHLEKVGEALDPFLVEPEVWSFEFGRAVSDQSSGLAARTPNFANNERRNWSLREVSTMLALRAEGGRVEQLRSLGLQLQANAAAQIEDSSTQGAREHLAAVRNWAAALDRGTYELHQEGDKILIKQAADPEAEQVLAETNADLRRASDATALVVRHAHVRDKGGRAPDITAETMSADLATARELLEHPPQTGLGVSPDGPVAVAASAVELHLTDRTTLPEVDVLWSASVLLQVAEDVAAHPDRVFDDSVFDHGADRSAGRALPFLLLPRAIGLRQSLGVSKEDDLQELVALCCVVAARAANEVRLAYARGLDAIWAAPCDFNHLFGRCHHRIAFDLVNESFLDSAFGPWDFETQRRPMVRIEPPHASSLDELMGDEIYVRGLTPTIRAMGSAAVSVACCSSEARQSLESLLSAHQRAMLAYENGYHHRRSDTLVAVRAALWQATVGRDDVILGFIDEYLGDSQLLAESLRAVAAAGDERADAGEQARRLWPQVMDRVLDYAETHPSASRAPTWGGYAEADLIPNPSEAWHYLTSELASQPYPWRNMLAWIPQVERWLGSIDGDTKSIDHLVVAVRELDMAHQLDPGLKWVERVVERSAKNCARTFTLPEWLHELRAELATNEQATNEQATNEQATNEHLARWQRVVDLLVVAGDSRVADLAD